MVHGAICALFLVETRKKCWSHSPGVDWKRKVKMLICMARALLSSLLQDSWAKPKELRLAGWREKKNEVIKCETFHIRGQSNLT